MRKKHDRRKRPESLYSHRGSLFRRLWPVTHYLVTNVSVSLGYFYFHLLNRTTVIGKRNVPRKPNTLLLSNHRTMIDSFLVGLCAYYPWSVLRPSLIPWNPAAAENFYRNPVLAWLADNWKCLPVKKGRKDMQVMYKMVEALQSGPMTLFPEGTRSRSGEIGKGRGGTGFVILQSWPAVVPVYVEGIEKVLPIGSVLPRLFKRVYVNYGPPLDLSEFKKRGANKETAQAVVDKVMKAIKTLQVQVQELKAQKQCP